MFPEARSKPGNIDSLSHTWSHQKVTPTFHAIIASLEKPPPYPHYSMLIAFPEYIYKNLSYVQHCFGGRRGGERVNYSGLLKVTEECFSRVLLMILTRIVA